MIPRQTLSALLLLVLIPLPWAAEPSRTQERETFMAAEAALNRGESEAFEELVRGLADYPLYPYLRYEHLSRRLGSAEAEKIADFLAEHADTPQAGRLRRSWLARLAERGLWQEYVRFYVPDDSIARRCHYLRGLMQSDRRDEALGQVEGLWLRGESLPNACDPLLEEWRREGKLTTDLVWRRIVLAMAAGEVRLASHLGESLPASERVWLDIWLAIHRNPKRVLDERWPEGSHPRQTRILAHGIARLARSTPSRAADAWDGLASRHLFPTDQAQMANAAIGFALAERGDRRGLSYLSRVPAGEDNFDLQERRLRVALELGYWDGVAEWIEAMPDGQRKAEHWLYWQARAEEVRGDTEKARALYAAAAAERSLWGFLAAERVGLPYKLGREKTPADPQRIARIEQSSAAARIRELKTLGRDLDARREWYWLTRAMEREDLMAAAVVAERRGWTTQAIFTLAKSGYWDDLGLRFPLSHREIVREQAGATGLDEAWIYAILRQESAFDPKAVSHAGATGLMQLMPATARQVALSLGLPRPSRNDLYDPELNIALGSTYLLDMRRRYLGNPVLATAAYNAGPGNVDRWLPEHPQDADVWVATIPYSETRGYVRRVLAYRVIYDCRLGYPIKPLHSIMGPIGREEAAAGESGIGCMRLACDRPSAPVP